MNLSKCPHCGVKLGNFLYAEACPRCHGVLEHNSQTRLTPVREEITEMRSWPVRAFFSLVRFVES
jgi:hypothetical protein